MRHTMNDGGLWLWVMRATFGFTWNYIFRKIVIPPVRYLVSAVACVSSHITSNSKLYTIECPHLIPIRHGQWQLGNDLQFYKKYKNVYENCKSIDYSGRKFKFSYKRIDLPFLLLSNCMWMMDSVGIWNKTFMNIQNTKHKFTFLYSYLHYYLQLM